MWKCFMEPQWDGVGVAGYLCSVQQGWAVATLPPEILTRSKLSSHSPLPPPCFQPIHSSCSMVLSHPAFSISLFCFPSPFFLLWQEGSEMAISGKAVSLYFEEKLQEIFPGQSFPETPEPESLEIEQKEEDDTDDSGEDFIQPRRKRLKTDEKVVHIKWEQTMREVKNCLPTSHTSPLFEATNEKKKKGRNSLYKLLGLSSSLPLKDLLSTWDVCLHQNSWGQKHRRAAFPPYFMDTQDVACTDFEVGFVLQ